MSNWKIKTDNYTAISGDKIIVDNSSGGVTIDITLPANPLIGDEVSIINAIEGSTVHITPGNKPYIDSSLYPPLKLATPLKAVTLIYVGNLGWMPSRSDMVISGLEPD